MVALVNLIAIGLAAVCIVLVIGSRDRMRTLEFRLALIDRRLREAQAGATPPAATEAPPEPDRTIIPEPPSPTTVAPAEPETPSPQSQQIEPVASAPTSAAPGPSLEERF